MPGADELLKGKVSDEMFRELRQTERNIAEYMDQPVSIITGMLSAWLGTSEEDTSPARIKLKQLVDTCESLVFVEEILTVRGNSSSLFPKKLFFLFSRPFSRKPENDLLLPPSFPLPATHNPCTETLASLELGCRSSSYATGGTDYPQYGQGENRNQ